MASVALLQQPEPLFPSGIQFSFISGSHEIQFSLVYQRDYTLGLSIHKGGNFTSLLALEEQPSQVSIPLPRTTSLTSEGMNRWVHIFRNYGSHISKGGHHSNGNPGLRVGSESWNLVCATFPNKGKQKVKLEEETVKRLWAKFLLCICLYNFKILE